MNNQDTEEFRSVFVESKYSYYAFDAQGRVMYVINLEGEEWRVRAYTLRYKEFVYPRI